PGAAGTLVLQTVRIDASDNIFVVGGFTGTITLGGSMLTSSVGKGGSGGDLVALQYSSSGSLVAAHRPRRPGDTNLTPLTLDSAGNLVVSGVVSSATDLGTGMLAGRGGSDFYVAKYAPTGSALWAHRYGSAVDDRSTAVAVAPGGEIAVVGILGGNGDVGG